MPGPSARDITLTVGGLHALQQLSFDVAPGSVVDAVGRHR